jgi:predicted ABC-type ATPase
MRPERVSPRATALALLVAATLCAGQEASARAAVECSFSAAAGELASPADGAASMTVRGTTYDLRAPLPTPPRTLPDGHPLLRATAVEDATAEFGGRLAPAFDTPHRHGLHDKIVAETLAGVAPQVSPVLYVMAGGGGSGKGYVRARLEASGDIPTRNRALVDPDAIKEKLPEWQSFTAAGDGRAAETLHEESSMLTKRIRAEAAKRKVDVVLEMTLADAGGTRELFERFRRSGYEIRLFGVATDARRAAALAGQRAKRSNRWVPWPELLKAHRDLAAAFAGYAPLVDRASLFDANGEQPELIAERGTTGQLAVVDATKFHRWLRCSRAIDPSATTLGEIYARTR